MGLECTELRLEALGVAWREEEEQKLGLRNYQDIGLGPGQCAQDIGQDVVSQHEHHARL